MAVDSVKYNIIQEVRELLTSGSITLEVPHIINDDTPDEYVLIQEGQSFIGNWPLYSEETPVQVTVCSKSFTESESVAFTIYDHFKEKFIYTLPAPVGKTGVTTFLTTRIAVTSKPVYVGKNEHGVHCHNFNLDVLRINQA